MQLYKLCFISLSAFLSACIFDFDGENNSDSSPAAGEVLPHTKLQLNHHAERIQHSLSTMGF